MKQFRVAVLWAVLLGIAVLRGATNEEILARQGICPAFGKRERFLNARVVELVARFHYSPKTLSPALSAQWFNEYFKVLDPQKIFFQEKDLDDFRPFENILCDTRNHDVRIKFVEKVYQRLLLRVQQYAMASTAMLNEPMNYTDSEYMEMERKDAPWAKTPEELREQWRLRVKSALLADVLQKEEEEEKAKAHPEAETKNTFKRPPVKERLAKQYAQTYERRLDATSLEIMEVFLNAFTHLFDPHTDYMAPESREDFDIHLRLSLQGIGATLSLRDSYCEVISLVPGGPADKEGTLKEGDRIVEVMQDGGEPVDVIDMPLNKTVKMIRGAKGTAVTLTILEAGTGLTKQVRIIRDEVKLQDAEASSEIREMTTASGKKLRNLIIYLPSFYADFEARSKGDKNYKSSSRDVKNLLEAGLKEGGIDSVVLDFRGNGGGSLDDAIKLAGLFFTSGPVVQTRRSTGKVLPGNDPDPSCLYDGPLFVLVDRFSASASEIVAAALQDMGRALVIGTASTHGKGTVQTSVDLNSVFARLLAGFSDSGDSMGSLKITIQKFYRINGASTQLKGVLSDIVFPSYQDALDSGEEKIPNALAWDEIASSTYPKFNGFKEAIPALTAASMEHRAKSKDYQEYVKDVQDFEALIKNKQLPLNYQERKAYLKKSNDVTKRLRKLSQQGKKARKRAKAKQTAEELEEEKNARDVIMDETLFIIETYMDMEKK